MTVPLAARRRPRFRHADALAAAALESLGEAVALVVDDEIAFATTAFAARVGDEWLPLVLDELIAAGGGLDDGGPDGTVAEVRPLESVDGAGWCGCGSPTRASRCSTR